MGALHPSGSVLGKANVDGFDSLLGSIDQNTLIGGGMGTEHQGGDDIISGLLSGGSLGSAAEKYPLFGGDIAAEGQGAGDVINSLLLMNAGSLGASNGPPSSSTSSSGGSGSTSSSGGSSSTSFSGGSGSDSSKTDGSNNFKGMFAGLTGIRPLQLKEGDGFPLGLFGTKVSGDGFPLGLFGTKVSKEFGGKHKSTINKMSNKNLSKQLHALLNEIRKLRSHVKRYIIHGNGKHKIFNNF